MAQQQVQPAAAQPAELAASGELTHAAQGNEVPEAGQVPTGRDAPSQPLQQANTSAAAAAAAPDTDGGDETGTLLVSCSCCAL
jgi:hypothetical protein